MKQKGLRKLASMILAVVMVMAMSITGFAASDYIITISNSVTDSEYSAYKIFDATYSGDAVAYTISESDDWYTLVTESEDSPFSVTATITSGIYNVSLKNSATNESVTEWFNAITETEIPGEAAATGTGNGGSIKLDVEEAGYYYITTTTGATVTVTTAKPDASVIDKNQTPGSELKKEVNDATVSIGDTVTYTITSNVPKYDGETKITEYTFKDTLSEGLTAPSGDEITVKIKDSSGNDITLGETDVEVSVKDNVITISFDPSSIESYPSDATIEISYTATVNGKAAYENKNEVNQSWTENSEGKTTDAKVYTYGFDLKKYANEIKDENKLDGAEFTLSNRYGVIYFVPVEGGYRVATSAEEEDATEKISAGSVQIFGLDSGSYTLTETKAPDGYNKLTGGITVYVGGAAGSYNEDTGINVKSTDVINNAGSILPSTGGMGTTIFYIVGGVLVLGAAVLFVTRKRLGSEN